MIFYQKSVFKSVLIILLYWILGGVRNVQPKEIFRKSTEILRKPTGIKNAHEPKVVEINEPKASSSNPASTTKTKESGKSITVAINIHIECISTKGQIYKREYTY